MPLPLILGIGAAVAAATGVGAGTHGGIKMKKANDAAKETQARHEKNQKRYTELNDKTVQTLDDLGKFELEISASFQQFSDLFEMIHNRPEFEQMPKNDLQIEGVELEELKQTSAKAAVLLGGLGGAAAGTLGGFAASGVTTGAVMALGTASTGTAISTLSGAAATKATLAALGGGAIKAGGGGIALGTTVLGAASAGAAIFVGGVIFSIVGTKLSNKADQAYSEMLKAEAEINKACKFLNELRAYALMFRSALKKVNSCYCKYLEKMKQIVVSENKTDYFFYTREEQYVVENCAMLVQLLFAMIKTQLLLKPAEKDGNGEVNVSGICSIVQQATTQIDSLASVA